MLITLGAPLECYVSNRLKPFVCVRTCAVLNIRVTDTTPHRDSPLRRQDSNLQQWLRSHATYHTQPLDLRAVSLPIPPLRIVTLRLSTSGRFVIPIMSAIVTMLLPVNNNNCSNLPLVVYISYSAVILRKPT